jgi:hypothetical protein
MNKTTPVFGTEHTFAELCEKITGFSHDDASPAEQVQMVSALKILAQDTVDRWHTVHQLELDLKSKITMAQIRERMNDVLDVTDKGNSSNPWIDRCLSLKAWRRA